MFAQVENLNPALPKMPDLSGIERLLTHGQTLIHQLATEVEKVNTGLFVSGLWVGAVSVAVIWFVIDKYKASKIPPA